ncbi:gamma-butyrobetaine hydroxylase-like domain-containing protein [Mesorhizobium marinum]|uniref:Gamma-butyrobetaine hydroxylase-like domain-containing protein n=1 Tax=Mesorhizobium marinum TaxID=3228790 RepID=A0ABV3R4Q7_9HYPH
MSAPKELRVSKDRRTLTVVYHDHEPFELPAELLRVTSPSAEVQGHAPDQRVTVPGKRNVSIARMEPVGNYAVRIVFDDLHDTGIFTWSYLHRLGHDKEQVWSDYLASLESKALSRD